MMEAPNSSVNVCASKYGTADNAFLWVCIVLGMLVVIGLSFTYQRINLCKQLCWSLPGIVQPVNLLTHSADYIINLVLFAALSGDIGIVLMTQHMKLPTTNPYTAIFYQTVLTPVFSVLEVSVKYFPLFSCVDAPIPLVGHIVGLIYLPFLLCHIIVRDVGLSCVLGNSNDVITGLYIGMRLPIYLVLLCIVVWYIYAVVRDCVLCRKLGFGTAMEQLNGAHRTYNYYKQCVTHLFKKKLQNSRCLSSFCPCILSPRKLPLRFSAAVTVSTLILYQVCFLLSGSLFNFLSFLERILGENESFLVQWFETNHLPGGFYTAILEVARSLLVVLPVSPVVSLVICFLLIIHMVVSVYKSLQASARGNTVVSKGFSSFRLAASLRYAGYQIAYCLAAFVSYTLVLWILGLIAILFFFGFKYMADYAFYALASILIPLAWIGFVLAAQVIACKTMFLKRGGGRFIIISNQKIFQWFMFVLFIYNTIIGLASALFRVLISATMGLLLMLRLDRVILMKGFEPFDIGHNTYIGFLHVDLAYNNAVVHVFVRLMADLTTGTTSRRSPFIPTPPEVTYDTDLAYGVQENNTLSREMKKRKTYGVFETQDTSERPSKVRSHRIRNRWLVAYTLLRNPSLQPLTASQLQDKDKDTAQ
ncbi:receptor for retinol uptake STRA6-like isoform X3 [Halichondria panicea]|uniref:receptor for retinol uptake STRA6-like isoform X3 n=1 Tax=Halichondria panicea TaxID=6063 RepID=UPI00312B3E28